MRDYLDQGNPWTNDDYEHCAECGKATSDYALIDNEPICYKCEMANDLTL